MKKAKKSHLLGQAMSEYLILTALIALSSIAVVQLFSSNLRQKIGHMSEIIRGAERKNFRGTKLEARHYKVYDLGDFHHGITHTKKD